MLPISLRMSLAIAIVLLVAVLITAALNVLKFQQIMEAHEQARYAFVTRDLVQVLEQSMNLGLPLDQIDNAEQILERQLQLDPSISGIAVFDPAGRVLYQASRLAPGWVEAVLRQDAVLEGAERESYTSRPIFNAFGQPVGGVLVRHTLEARARRNEAILNGMSLAVLSAAVVGVVVVGVGSSRLLKPFRTRLLTSAALLRRARSETPGQGEAEGEFETLAHALLRDLRRAEREVDQLAEGTPAAGRDLAS